MDEPSTRPAASAPCNERLWLLALLAIVLVLRVWLIVNTEVPARDSIGFIRIALKFDHMAAGEAGWSWAEILKSNHQHPGYPFLVWLTAAPLRAVWGTTPEVMRISAQLVSIVASVLLALVMFRLGTRLWNVSVGFFAALLFQFLPTSGQHLSDGISDGLFLLLAITAADTIIRAREAGSLKGFALGGVLAGLAYLVRPEGILVLPAEFLFCLGLQFAKEHRASWRTTFGGLAALGLGWAVAGAPYYVATGQLTIKPSITTIIDGTAVPHATLRAPASPSRGPLFAANFLSSDSRVEQLARTLRALTAEVSQAFNYVGFAFVIWALLFCRGTLARRPGAYLLASYALVHAAGLVALGMKMNYVSDRHVMILVALGCYPCVIGMAHFVSLATGRWAPFPKGGFLDNRAVMLTAAACLLVLIGICSAKTVTRLHGNRVGNHEAGLWLARELRPGDRVDDDHNWSHFYAGQVFTEFTKIETPPDARRFIVLTRSKDDEVKEARDQLENMLRKEATLVYWWPRQVESDRARIVIYSAPHDFAQNLWQNKGGIFVPIIPVNQIK